MATLPVTEFITLYKEGYEKALEWIEKNNIESISWEQLHSLDAVCKANIKHIHLLERIIKETNHIEQTKYISEEYRLTYAPLKMLLQKSHVQLALLINEHSEPLMEISKLDGVFRSLLPKSIQEQILALFKNVDDVMKLKNDSFAKSLFKMAPKYFASLIQDYKQFAAMDKMFGESLSAVFTGDRDRFISFFETREPFIEMLKENGRIPGCLLNRENGIPDKILTFFENYKQFMELVRIAPDGAVQLYSFESVKVISLFQSPESLLELTRCNESLAISLIKKAPETFAALFENCDQLSELADISFSTASQLISANPVKFTSLFKTPEQFLKLAENKPATASMLIDNAADKVTSLFTTHTQWLKLLETNISISNSLTDKALGLFDTQEKLTELEKINPAIYKKFCLLRKQDSISDDLSSPLPVNQQPPTEASDYSFLMDVISSIVIAGGAALIIAALVLTQLPLLIAGAALALTGVAALATNRFGLFACGAVDGSSGDENQTQLGVNSN